MVRQFNQWGDECKRRAEYALIFLPKLTGKRINPSIRVVQCHDLIRVRDARIVGRGAGVQRLLCHQFQGIKPVAFGNAELSRGRHRQSRR